VTKDPRFGKDSGLEQQVTEHLLAAGKRLSVMISHLIGHLKKSGMKGAKYGNSVRSARSKTT
jgi:hypothetical protein